MYPEALWGNLDLVGVFGRYDDLYCLIGTPLEENMWAVMKEQFEEDRANLERGNAISLLAKWIKTADASSERTRRLGIFDRCGDRQWAFYDKMARKYRDYDYDIPNVIFWNDCIKVG